jgi:hypothetical protein
MRKLMSSILAAGALCLSGCVTSDSLVDNNTPPLDCNSLTFKVHDPQAEVNARANDNMLGGAVLSLLGLTRGGNMGAAVHQYGNAQMQSGVAMQNGQVHAGKAWTERSDWCYNPLSSPTYNCITLSEPTLQPGKAFIYPQDLVYPTRAVNLINLKNKGINRIYFTAEIKGCNQRQFQFGLLKPGASSYSFYQDDRKMLLDSGVRFEEVEIDKLIRLGLTGPVDVHWNILDKNGSKFPIVAYRVLLCNN